MRPGKTTRSQAAYGDDGRAAEPRQDAGKRTRVARRYESSTGGPTRTGSRSRPAVIGDDDFGVAVDAAEIFGGSGRPALEEYVRSMSSMEARAAMAQLAQVEVKKKFEKLDQAMQERLLRLLRQRAAEPAASTPPVTRISETRVRLASFAIGSWSLRLEHKAELARLAAAYPGGLFHLDGHASTPGTEAYNDRLASSRRSAVLHELFSLGVRRFDGHVFGEVRPLVAEGGDVNARALNRRVEIRVEPFVPGGGSPAPRKEESSSSTIAVPDGVPGAEHIPCSLAHRYLRRARAMLTAYTIGGLGVSGTGSRGGRLSGEGPPTKPDRTKYVISSGIRTSEALREWASLTPKTFAGLHDLNRFRHDIEVYGEYVKRCEAAGTSPKRPSWQKAVEDYSSGLRRPVP